MYWVWTSCDVLWWFAKFTVALNLYNSFYFPFLKAFCNMVFPELFCMAISYLNVCLWGQTKIARKAFSNFRHSKCSRKEKHFSSWNCFTRKHTHTHTHSRVLITPFISLWNEVASFPYEEQWTSSAVIPGNCHICSCGIHPHLVLHCIRTHMSWESSFLPPLLHQWYRNLPAAAAAALPLLLFPPFSSFFFFRSTALKC